ncbi:membrane protein, partial [Agrobacterium tumefaciens]
HKFERRIFAVLMAVGSLVAISALLRGESSGLVQFYLVVFAMGMVNAAVEHIEGLPIGLTYVTGALSRFGRGIGRFLLGDRSLDWGIQIVPWLGMLSGAICGAVLGAKMQSDALWVVAVAVFVVAIATLIIPRSLRQRYNQRVKIRRITP